MNVRLIWLAFATSGSRMPLGICIALACFAFQARAQFTVFHDFATDFLLPTSGLTEIADGVFLGAATTVPFIAPPAPVLYALNRSGALTWKLGLPQPSCGPGQASSGARVGQPIQASDSNFYGVVDGGCSPASTGQLFYNGYVYRLSFRGRPPSVTVLKTFPVIDEVGATTPLLLMSPLLEGPGGDLWGAENDGVFRISKDGKFFNVFPTGNFFPLGDFALGANGSIYGSALSNPPFGMLWSVIFQIPGPVLHGYLASSPVTLPGPVILGTDGLLYGAAAGGGANSCGTLFKLDPSNGAYTQLLDMPAAVCMPASLPEVFSYVPPPLVEAARGSLYSFYGVAGDGFGVSSTVFGYSPRGVPGGVHSFGTINAVVRELTQPVSGGIVGIASGNGNNFAFAITGPAPEPVITAFSQNSGAPGTTIVIRGNYLLGTTVVNFNSVSASYHVTSVNAIVATVPAGATSGPVTLGTPHGTAVSPISFTVP